MRALLLGLVLSACTLPQVMPEVRETPFVPTGEVVLYDRNASFDAVRVRSPHANLSRRVDGSWAGVLHGRPVDVSVTETRVTGVDLVLTRAESFPGVVVITGQFRGRLYRFELDDRRAKLWGPAVSVELSGREVGPTQTTYGPQGNLELRGEAGGPLPPWPQLAFALLALSL